MKKPEILLIVGSDGFAKDYVKNKTITAQTAGYPVVSDNGINNLPVFAFDGINSHGFDLSSGLTLNQDWIMLFVIDDEIKTEKRLFDQSGGTPLNGFYISPLAVAGGYIRISIVKDGSVSYNDFAVLNSKFNKKAVIAFVYTHATKKIRAYKNGRFIEEETFIYAIPDATNSYTAKIGSNQTDTSVLDRDLQLFCQVLDAESDADVKKRCDFFRRWLPQPTTKPEFALKITGDGTAIDTKGTRTISAQSAGYPVAIKNGVSGSYSFVLDGINNHGLVISPGLTLNQDWTMYFRKKMKEPAGTKALFIQRSPVPYSGLWIAERGGNGISFIVSDGGSLVLTEYDCYIDDELYHDFVIVWKQDTHIVQYIVDGVIVWEQDTTYSIPAIANNYNASFLQNETHTEVSLNNVNKFEFVGEALAISQVHGWIRTIKGERQ